MITFTTVANKHSRMHNMLYLDVDQIQQQKTTLGQESEATLGIG